MIGKETAKKWFEECKKEGKRFMNVVCDTFDWTDYPKFTDSPIHRHFIEGWLWWKNE